jgi:hypothetical protein
VLEGAEPVGDELASWRSSRQSTTSRVAALGGRVERLVLAPPLCLMSVSAIARIGAVERKFSPSVIVFAPG